MISLELIISRSFWIYSDLAGISIALVLPLWLEVLLIFSICIGILLSLLLIFSIYYFKILISFILFWKCSTFDFYSSIKLLSCYFTEAYEYISLIGDADFCMLLDFTIILAVSAITFILFSVVAFALARAHSFSQAAFLAAASTNSLAALLSAAALVLATFSASAASSNCFFCLYSSICYTSWYFDC